MKSLEERLFQIVSLSYETICNKIANGNVVVDNEASFQLQLGTILQSLGNLFVYSKDERFEIVLEHSFKLHQPTAKCANKKARCDIYLKMESATERCVAIIELKFFKKANHREPNNRYDFFADLQNLEQYERQGESQLNFMIVGTDHPHYFDNAEPLSEATADFNFREGAKYSAGTPLQYRTEKPYGKDIVLTYDHIFHWDRYSNKLAFMKINLI